MRGTYVPQKEANIVPSLPFTSISETSDTRVYYKKTVTHTLGLRRWTFRTEGQVSKNTVMSPLGTSARRGIVGGEVGRRVGRQVDR